MIVQVVLSQGIYTNSLFKKMIKNQASEELVACYCHQPPLAFLAANCAPTTFRPTMRVTIAWVSVL